MVCKRTKVRKCLVSQSAMWESLPAVMYFRHKPDTIRSISFPPTISTNRPQCDDNYIPGLGVTDRTIVSTCNSTLLDKMQENRLKATMRNRNRLIRRRREQVRRQDYQYHVRECQTKEEEIDSCVALYPKRLTELSIGKEVLKARRDRTRRKRKARNARASKRTSTLGEHRNHRQGAAERMPAVICRNKDQDDVNQVRFVMTTYVNAHHCLLSRLLVACDICTRESVDMNEFMGTTAERLATGGQVKALMHCEDLEHFEGELARRQEKWSQAFVDHFNKKLKPLILRHANRWLLDSLGLYSGGTEAITTNPAEGINTMIKSLHKFGTVLMDTCVMSLHFLCKAATADEEMSRAGRGSWGGELCKQHLKEALDIAAVVSDEDFRTPEEIAQFLIERAKEAENDIRDPPAPAAEVLRANEKAAASAEEALDDEHEPDKDVSDANDIEMTKQGTEDDQEIDEMEMNDVGKAAVQNDKNSDEDMTKPHDPKPQFDTQRTLAVKLVAEQRIYRVPNPRNKHLFVAEGSRGDYYAVSIAHVGKRLKETCGCVARRTCYHILAARLMDGIPLDERTGRPLNLTALLQNSRAPKDRCRGSKKGCPNDYVEVNPAPDSVMGTSMYQPEASSTPTKTAAPMNRKNKRRRPTTIEEVEEDELDDKKDNHTFAASSTPKKPAAARRLSKSFDQNASKKAKVSFAEARFPKDANDILNNSDAETHISAQIKEEPQNSFENINNSDLEDPQHQPVDLDNPEQQPAEVKGSAPKATRKPKTYCYCSESRDSDMMIQCEKCSKWFHCSCVQVPDSALKNEKEDWDCPSCTMPMVFSWGGKLGRYTLSNTCPVDNALSIFGLYFVEHPNALKFLGTSAAEKALASCMRKFLGANNPRDLETAKNEWIEFLLRKKVLVKDDQWNLINVHGGEYDRCFDHLRSVFRMESTSSCDNEKCSNPIRLHTYPDCILNSGDSMDSIFEKRWESCCYEEVDSNGGNKKCCGTRTYSSKRFTAKNPWFVVIDCEPCSLKQVLSLPRNIKIDGKQYKLGSVSLYANDHFTMMMVWRGRRFHYNGSRRIQAVPLEKALSGRHDPYKPNRALYFLD